MQDMKNQVQSLQQFGRKTDSLQKEFDALQTYLQKMKVTLPSDDVEEVEEVDMDTKEKEDEEQEELRQVQALKKMKDSGSILVSPYTPPVPKKAQEKVYKCTQCNLEYREAHNLEQLRTTLSFNNHIYKTDNYMQLYSIISKKANCGVPLLHNQQKS